MEVGTLAIVTIGLVLGTLPFTVAAARRRYPHPTDMRPDEPLNEAAALFVAGISVTTLLLLALMQGGVLWPLGLAALAAGLHIALRRSKRLTRLYRSDRLLAFASVLAAAYLWTSFVS